MLRLGNIYEDSGENTCNAYDLLVKGGMKTDDPRLYAMRQRIIQKELKDGESYISLHWLEKNDPHGFEQMYTALLEGVGKTKWPGEAYKLAAARGDIQRVAQARNLILEINAPAASLRFFQKAEDNAGIYRAISALSHHYKVPEAQVATLVGKME